MARGDEVMDEQRLPHGDELSVIDGGRRLMGGADADPSAVDGRCKAALANEPDKFFANDEYAGPCTGPIGPSRLSCGLSSRFCVLKCTPELDFC